MCTDMACNLVDLSDQIFTVDPASPNVHINPMSVIAAPGTNLKTCMVCFTSKELPAFAKFCYQTAKVTGDGTDLGAQRHPGTICIPCMRTTCMTPISMGRHAVPCPGIGCQRVLQIRELKRSVVVVDTVHS
jgi:hypothetical protein